ncbi:hypothetical protein [Sphingomonas jeddahensis]|uniref:HipA-like C-terminal domain-containing protein n=1 Tax=Sphingomonas jeddahensis TaxID=1915074 RepID=A0A1V2EUK4_9SPHN|nr:hypothetical protein [Sphingomonas jeddahensis]ONF95988.1 hypothetical protein SPHI_19150 [Sphingomonas jeddahensis]
MIAQLSAFTKVGPQLPGSNPGAQYERQGVRYYVKGSAVGSEAIGIARAQNEVLTAKLLKAAGAGVVDMDLAQGLPPELGSRWGVASRFIHGKPLLPATGRIVEAVWLDFAAHAWLANRDVIGHDFLNTVIVDGVAINTDQGGGLLFTGQGRLKYPELAFGDMPADVMEWFTLRDTRINPAAWFYDSMSDVELRASARKVLAVTDATIIQLVHAYGPGGSDLRSRLANSLIARREATGRLIEASSR